MSVRELPEMSWKGAATLWLLAMAITAPIASLAPNMAPEGVGFAQVMGFFAVVYLVAVAIGWSIGSRLGLGAPLVEAWLEGRRADARDLVRAAALGAVLGISAVAFLLALAGPLPEDHGPDILPPWSGLAFALYGGIGEELLFRFALMALTAWIITHLTRFFDTLLRWSRPSWELEPSVTTALWGGLVISSIVFGLAHLGQGTNAAPDLVKVSLRMAAGFLFGWLYWKRGIESAMAAHLAYDLVVAYAIIVLV
jgi:membrane protease YdiL (CAAX protease family)